MEQFLSPEDRSAFKEAIRKSIAYMPYSLPTVLKTGKGSVVSPTQSEIEKTMKERKISYDEAYDVLCAENYNKIFKK
jgi:hypothetical protein